MAIWPIATVLSIAIRFSSHLEMRFFFSLATLFFAWHSLFCLLFSRSFSTLRFRLNQVASNRHNKINFIFTVALRNVSNKIYTHTPKYTQSLTLTRCLFSCFVLIRRFVYLCVCCIRSLSFFFFSFSDSISVSGNCFYFIIFSYFFFSLHSTGIFCW